MNLRILKKLSKRAAPLLPLIGDSRKQFSAEPGDSYTGLLIMERKHWERGRSVHADTLGEHEIKTPARDGRGWVYARPPDHPRKGTVMVGAVSGYYEPEWSEETAWEALREAVFWRYVELDSDGDMLSPRPPQLESVSTIFAAAADMAAELAAERA